MAEAALNTNAAAFNRKKRQDFVSQNQSPDFSAANDNAPQISTDFGEPFAPANDNRTTEDQTKEQSDHIKAALSGNTDAVLPNTSSTPQNDQQATQGAQPERQRGLITNAVNQFGRYRQEITQLKQENASLQPQMAKLKKDIAEIEKQIAPLERKKTRLKVLIPIQIFGGILLCIIGLVFFFIPPILMAVGGAGVDLFVLAAKNVARIPLLSLEISTIKKTEKYDEKKKQISILEKKVQGNIKQIQLYSNQSLLSKKQQPQPA